MKQIYLFFKKIDVLYFAIILIIMIAGFYFFGKNIYSPLSDIGREFYIPLRMTQGFVLYRDISNIYGPLGYMLNALLLKIFGSGLNTFLYIGFILSYLSVILIFQINKLFLPKSLAFLLSIFFIPSCIFFPTFSNWITPYSYSVLWGLFGILVSIFSLFKYLKTDNFNFFILSILTYGFSLCCKLDFALFIILLAGIAIFKKLNFKSLIILFFTVLIFPIISVLVLLNQGCSLNDLYSAYKYIAYITSSYPVKYFYYYYNFIPSVSSLKNAILSLIYPYPSSIFRIIGYLSFLLIIKYIISFFKNKKLNQNEFLHLCFLSAGFLISIKCIGAINLAIYGTYLLPVILSSVFVVIYTEFFQNKKYLMYVVCLLLFIFYTVNCFQSNVLYNVNIGEYKVKIYPEYINGMVKLQEYIKDNVKSDDTLLILPEGSIINYAENIKSDDKYFILNPVYADMYGMSNILNDIIIKKPDFIVFSNLVYTDYPYQFFKETYGKELYEYVKEHYKYEKAAGDKIEFEIYKLTEKM